MAFAHNGAYWRQMRKLCVTKIFSRRRAETWLAVRDGYGALAVNLGQLIFNLTVSVIFRAAFSTRDEDGLDEFNAILQEFSSLLGLFHIGDFFPWLGWVGRRGFSRRLRTARGALDKFIDRIIHEHMRRGKNAADPDADLVDGLLAFLAEANPIGGKHHPR
ncbi:Cytochrome P450 84A1 [Hordeum vulgare]|nr:Cytochrome P450 84A1 [Hordeum vulgare]